MGGKRGKLIIICGLPGSGKTTTALSMEKKQAGIRFSADDWMNALSINLYNEDARARIEALQWRLCQQLLSLGLAAIVEWGTWSRQERDTLRTKARELGASVELYYLAASLDVLFDRIRRRGGVNPPIEREMLNKWTAMFQAPTAEEMALYDHAATILPSNSLPSPNRVKGQLAPPRSPPQGAHEPEKRSGAGHFVDFD